MSLAAFLASFLDPNQGRFQCGLILLLAPILLLAKEAKKQMRYMLTSALLGLLVSASYGASTAQSSAYGEYVNLHILPVLGSPIVVTSGPLPVTAGTAPPPYSGSNQVASAIVSAAGLGTLLQTGILTVHAASGVPNTNAVSADA